MEKEFAKFVTLDVPNVQVLFIIVTLVLLIQAEVPHHNVLVVMDNMTFVEIILIVIQ